MGQVFDIYIHTSYILSFTFCFLHYDWSSPLFFFLNLLWILTVNSPRHLTASDGINIHVKTHTQKKEKEKEAYFPATSTIQANRLRYKVHRPENIPSHITMHAPGPVFRLIM